ncbi:MAG TPA: dTDP-glucose 4,6-dehydratase [bacterium]|nr:dTDP-glucose 4,6-dehydratase [bacterium]
MRKISAVLVTGGAGFIGSNFVRYALNRHPDWRVTVLDKLTYAGNLANLEDTRDRITFLEGDIADRLTVRRAMHGVDAVVNFAAESHVDRSLLDAAPFVRTNVEGVLVLLEETRRVTDVRLLQVSTDEVYGDMSKRNGHSREDDPLRPRSPYAATKAGAEHLVSSYHASYQLDLVTVRGSNTYGPYQYPEKIIPLFITNALAGMPLPVYGDGSAVRDYMHVHDHCAGIDLVLHDGVSGECYNLGARLQISGVDVARRVLHILNKPADLIRFVEDRPGHDYRYSVDPSKAESLGWQRQYTFDHGLSETIAWYASHTAWWEQVRLTRGHQHLMTRWYAKR